MMIVREANPNDLNDIVMFQLAMARETESVELNRETVVSGVSAVLNDPKKGRYYLAEESGVVVGSLLTTYEWSDWRDGTVLWIHSVYVLPDHRRKGIYSKMYFHVKAEVEKRSELKGIRLYAERDNITAHQTYHKLGMTSDHYITFEWLKE